MRAAGRLATGTPATVPARARRRSRGSSSRQLDAVAEPLERLGIGEGLDVLHRLAMDDVAYRELDDFAALGARNVHHLHDLRGNVARRGVGADLLPDSVHERIVER